MNVTPLLVLRLLDNPTTVIATIGQTVSGYVVAYNGEEASASTLEMALKWLGATGDTRPVEMVGPNAHAADMAEIAQIAAEQAKAAEPDFSHLNALQERRHREQQRLAVASTETERAFRTREIASCDREIAAEYAFLGIQPAPAVAEMSDADLLAELTA